MTRRILIFLFFILLSSLLLPFNIGDFSFYITNETIFKQNKLANKSFQFYEDLSLLSSFKEWSFGITFRGNNFFKQTPNETLDKTNLDIRQVFLKYNPKNLEITLGNFYSLLGRGLVLSVLKNEDILRERTILGANVHYTNNNLDVKLMGGILKDETAKQKWNLIGTEVGLRFLKKNQVGFNLSYIKDIETFTGFGPRFTYSIAFRGEEIFKNFSYYTEIAFLNFIDQDRDNGYGFFTNITYYKNHITGFLEFKRYDHFNNGLNSPPVADRNDEVSQLYDTIGTRCFLQYSFYSPDLTFFFNFGRYKEFEDTGNHIYGGFNLEDLFNRFSLNCSYGVRDILYPIKRFESHSIFQITDRLSIELQMKDKRYQDDSFKFIESDHILQFSYAPLISLFISHQYSYNKIISLNHFYHAGVRILLKGNYEIELTGGTIRGGQICSGGQCFISPPFKGIKLSLLLTFY